MFILDCKISLVENELIEASEVMKGVGGDRREGGIGQGLRLGTKAP